MDTFDVNSLPRRKDPLQSTSPNPSPSNNKPSTTSHMQTYTAGEDGSRLAAAARELGLQRARQPRRQVRHTLQRNASFLLKNPVNVLHLLLETNTEDARMRAIYSSHADFDRDENGLPILQGNGHGTIGDDDADDAIQDPHASGVGGDLLSAVLGIVKGMVGPAILYLPHGFATAGYLVAIPIMLATTCLFLYSSACLLDAWKLEDTRANTATTHPSTTTATESTHLVGAPTRRRILLSYPELAYRALGSTGESLVKLGIALMQSGVCLTYLIFVPQNLHTSLYYLCGWNIAPSVWLLAMLAVQVPLSWIRDIRKLTPTNLAANCLILYGLGVCLYFAVTQSVQSMTTNQPVDYDDTGIGNDDATSAAKTVTTWTVNVWDHFATLSPWGQDWFLFIGTSVLLFEGSITLLVPLQEAVESEEQRAQFPTMYRNVIMGIICFYAFFGITCWMSFGADVRTVLTTSLPEGVLATTVQFAYSVAVIFTFPLQNFPALEITTRTILSKLDGGRRRKRHTDTLTQRNVLSSLLVVLLGVVAVCTMDSLDKVVSLMGSLLGCPIAFVFPPLIHSRLDTNISKERLWLNYAVAGLGVVAMVVASITTLMKW